MTLMSPVAPAADLNALVLDQVKKMPRGGSYATNRVALLRLKSAAGIESGKFFVLPSSASPSFCSGATYLVLLKTIEELRRRGDLQLDYEALMTLMIREGQRDGHGIWGRWNANGPGTARLFHELNLGRNFISFDDARPGDFLKIFWTGEIGKNERGHSVIYLGREMKEGVEHVRFWSSNKPSGYGEKSVPRKEIARAIFSRIERPENLANAPKLPDVDPYLAKLLEVRSTFAIAAAKCGL